MRRKARTCAPAASSASAVAIAVAALALAACIGASGVVAPPGVAYADSGHSGVASNNGGLGYDRHWGWTTGEEYSAGYGEKRVGDEMVWCVWDGSNDYPSGRTLTGIDPVKAGVYSQDLVTDLALAHAYVWDFDLYRTPSGDKLKNDKERYAACVVLIYTILYREQGSHAGAASQHSMWVDGKSITGHNLNSQNNKDAYQWIKENRDNYTGYMQYFTLGENAPPHQMAGGLFRIEPKFGAITGTKRSAKASMTDGNGNYSLEGAVYGVFETKAKAETHDADAAIKTYKTDEDGKWETKKEYSPGTYYVAEIKASKGYELDENVYTVKVDAGSTESVSLKETPRGGGVKIVKKSANASATEGNSNYSLKGAVYGVFETKAKAKTREASNAVFTGKTNADGELESGTVLPAGTYYVTEIEASKGYELDEEIYAVEIDPGKVEKVNSKEEPKLGAVKVVKSSNNKKISGGNGCYSLKGAVYGVFETEALAKTHDAGKAMRSFTTDEAGLIQTGMVFPIGTYYVAETSPSAGYMLDEGVYKVNVEGGKTATANGADGSKEEPRSFSPEILLGKFDADTGEVSQGDASLAGAEFTVSFYAGYHAAASLPDSPTRSWTLKTDAAGRIDFQHPIKASGGDFYKSGSGRNTLPLGTVSIVETKAPAGYNLETPAGEPTVYVMQVVEDDSAEEGASAKPLNYAGSGRIEESNTAVDASDVVVRGDFRLVKECNVDIREDAPQEQTRVLVPGIQFQLVNDSQSAVLSPEDGTTLVEPGGVVCTIVTDEAGLASTRSGDANGWTSPRDWTGALAYGTYVVHEVIPEDVARAFADKYGTELMAVDDWKVNISSEGQMDPPALVDDKIPQSPLKVVKLDAETGRQIPLQVSFQLLDAAGNLVTYTSHYPEEETIDTWTSNAAGEVTLPMLLPGGTYTIKEVLAPDGYVLNAEGVGFTVDEYRTWADPVIVEYEDVPIKGVIELVKSDADTGEAIAGATYVVEAAEDVVTPEGTVRMEKGAIAATVVTDGEGRARTGELYLGTYKVYEAKSPERFALDTSEHLVTLESEGQDVPIVVHEESLADAPSKLRVLKVDEETGEPLAGAKFRVWQGEGDDKVGEVELETGADGIAELGHLAHGDYHIVETQAPLGHYLPEDVEQVDFRVDDQGFVGVAGGAFSDTLELVMSNRPCGMGTTLSDEGVHTVYASQQVKLTDVVSYYGATEGKEYTVTGTLHVRGTDEEGNAVDGGAVVDAEGNEVVATTTFTAEGQTGNATVTFVFDAYPYAGEKVVAFEEMREGERLFAVHADISDEGQTVEIREPSIGTTMTAGGSHKAQAADSVTLVDTVRYKGAVPGREYTVEGVLHVGDVDADGNVADGGALTDAEGNEVKAKASFTAEAQEGSVDVTFNFDASGLAGRKLVAFESMYEGASLFATHADIENKGQTVTFEPEAKTTLVDEATGNHTSRADKDVMLVDTIEYRGLVAGREYRAVGTLVDAWTEKAIKGADGKAVHAETTFTAEGSDGTVEVVFTFDASALEGKSAVAFESIMDGKSVIVKHADTNDEAQTVTFPSALTQAKDGADGDKVVVAKDGARIVDTIGYRGLTPGQPYIAEGELHLVKVGEREGKTDGGALKRADGTTVSAKAKFTPEEANGTVDVVFEFDASKLDGRTIVVFEKVNHIVSGHKTIMVARHEDVNDAEQMVTVSENAPKQPAKATPAPSTPATGSSSRAATPLTGDFAMRTVAGVVASLLASAGIAAYAYRRRSGIV